MSALPLILNVDDYESARYARSRALRAAGFDVIEAGSGGEALDTARTRQPDAIILDVNLPDLSGFEVCRRLKADDATKAIPVLYLSASATSSANRVDGLDIGAEAYLIDPIDVPVLVATVNAVMRGRRSESERAHILDLATAARDEAEAANRAKDEILATLSHEMRGPLNTIVGWAAMLRSGRLDPGRVDAALATIERAARQQTRLVDDLLDIARIGAGTLEVELRDIDLAAVVGETVAAVKPDVEQAGLTLDWVAEDPGAVKGDARRLEQVLWNLLSNAMKFTPSGGRITVRLAVIPGSVQLTVTDTGQGIEPAFLPHVFDRYRQADGEPSARRRGLGLGLAIVRHVVTRHGGTVTASSEGPGKGATFTVTLPRAS
jgi:signal transduction histidine kinase